uniref:Sema domain-containing protein n=1 Tax=Poecilia formosa TaxID=48698 RepID=A0A087XN17_POEFO
EGSAQSLKPRRSVSFSDVNLKLFKEPDFDGLSSMLVREDIGLLFIGARGKVITLSLDNITEKTSEANWIVNSSSKIECQTKGKSIEECDNYIRMMHTLDDGRILACGTKAFEPTCTHLMVDKGHITMENTTHSGRGKIPFSPKEKFTSIMEGKTLYTAGSTDFLGKNMALQKHGRSVIKNEQGSNWFNEPTIISIHMAEISKTSENNEDDYVFLFLTENSVEIKLSRVVRVCKSDVGGAKILKKKWSSFLKARLDCPFGDQASHALVQDVFLLQDENNITNSIFYATFTINPSFRSQSAVCAYKLSDIQQVVKGNFLTLDDSGKWQEYRGTAPTPYPGSCINDEMRAKGVKTSKDLPDTTLDFMRFHALMVNEVSPITGRPLLVRSTAQFSRIVVDKVTSLDGQQHIIMLIGNSK